MISDNQSICPKCGGQLKYYDHVQRLVRTKFGNKKWVAIRRLRCCKFSWIKGNLSEMFAWYKDHADYIKMHNNTRSIVEEILEMIRTKLTEVENAEN